jgi:glyoxylase-like metal-dependent hydrolase (beta-lactamase superfamily II)
MQIAPGLYSLSQTRGGRVHAFLIEDGDRLTLVDTLYDDDAGVILSELSAIGRKATDIQYILLTHSHKSHLGGLATIAKASGAKVMAHEWEIPVIEGRRRASQVGYKLPRPFNAEVYALQVGLNIGLGRHTPLKVEERLSKGMKVGKLEIMEVPGHTPGCVAFWSPEDRFLIAGDTVATWPAIDIGWPTFNLDPAAAQTSVGKMSELNPAVVCVGHGEPITEGAADVLRSLKK